MRESLHSYMKVGIVHFMAYPEVKTGIGPIVQSIQAIVQDDFFGAIEVTTIKDAMVKGGVAAILEAGGLEVGYGAQPVILGGKLDLNSEDPGERSRAVDAIKRCIDEAEIIGAKSVTVLSGKDPGADKRKAAISLLVESLVQLGRYAGGKGLMLQLETFDRDIDKRCLIGPTYEAVEVARRVSASCRNFGLMIDLGHLPQIGEDMTECLRIAAPYLTHIHIGNCIIKDKSHPFYGDNHPRFGVRSGENGVAELAEFLRGLFAIGYLGKDKKELPTVAFEVQPMPGERSEVVIAGSKRILQQAWALV